MDTTRTTEKCNCENGSSFLFVVIPAIQIAGSDVGTQGLQTLTMTNAGVGSTAVSPAGATIVQYAQSADGQFFIPGKAYR